MGASLSFSPSSCSFESPYLSSQFSVRQMSCAVVRSCLLEDEVGGVHDDARCLINVYVTFLFSAFAFSLFRVTVAAELIRQK